MTLSEINEDEIKANNAFKAWVSSSSFKSLHASKRRDLIDYVAGLNLVIADLKSEILRSEKWTK